MKRYRFKFEKILNLREDAEEILKRDFLSIMAQFEKEEEQLVSLATFYEDRIEVLLGKDELTSSELSLHKSYMLRLKDEMEKKKESVELFKKRSEDKKAELLTARKERKVLGIIKEKGRKEHIKVESKAEQALIDEHNYNRNRFKKDEDLF